ncbi:hypothetical protein HYC85_014045 [Camellia sinensis]|uniref:Uncharacterized protein n=1 Tax=Camellia sinensis TaxID=4442 RepID=A0A7J7H8L2_CAMSI|nr:hypothetical protein HYC85_014045 [Camellia sinensis]
MEIWKSQSGRSLQISFLWQWKEALSARDWSGFEKRDERGIESVVGSTVEKREERAARGEDDEVGLPLEGEIINGFWHRRWRKWQSSLRGSSVALQWWWLERF